MAGRRSISRQSKALAAGATAVVLALWHAGPAAASPNALPAPDDVANSAAELDALSPASSLTSKVEAAANDAAEAAATPPPADDDRSASHSRPAMTTRLPGISDERLARYKRQMYRTDI